MPSQTIQPTATPAKSNQSQPSLLPKPNIAPSPSKTYTIQRNPNVAAAPNVTPIQPKPIAPTPQQQLTPVTPTPIQSPAAVNSAAGGTTPNKQNMVVGIQSLGANTVTIKDGQLIVQGPDHAAATQIAQLLSTGAAKLANLNGKQVLLTTAPAKAGQQAAPITPVAPPPPREPTPPPPPREPTPPPPREPSPPPSLTVTAQLAQTPQGPRIILQGLQGVQLEQQQLVAIQQQVKQQLLKQQSIARQQGKVPPTKVTLQLSGPMIRKEESPAVVNQAQVQEQPPVPPPAPQAAPVAPAQMVSQQQALLGQQQPGNLVTPSKPRQVAPTMSTLPESVIKQGHFVIKDGKKVLVLPQAALAAHQASLQAPSPTANSSNNQSLLMQSLTSPSRQSTGLPSPTLNTTPLPVPDGDKFELTEDYIQQTIKDALKGGNLTPELQEKLMSQLDGDVNIPESLTKQRSRNSSRRRGGKGPKTIDPASGEPMDDEWQPMLRGKGGKGSDESSDEEEYKYRSPPSKVVKKLIPTGPTTDDKKRNKLTSMLFKQKEELKKDIAKKRAQLEKELSGKIAAEVSALKQKAQLKLAQQGKRRREEGEQVLGSSFA